MPTALPAGGAVEDRTTYDNSQARERRTPVGTLKKRREFLRIRGGGRWACGAFVIETRKRPDLDSVSGQTIEPRIGYTVTKRIGNAVVRNRIKRRFRAAVAELKPGELRNHHDYVLIARSGALKRTFADLTNDLREGLKRIHRPKRNSPTGKHR